MTDSYCVCPDCHTRHRVARMDDGAVGGGDSLGQSMTVDSLVRKYLTRVRFDLLWMVRQHTPEGGITCDEACAELGKEANALSPRFSELRRMSAVDMTEEVRRTRSGGSASPYVITDRGEEILRMYSLENSPLEPPSR